jgi:cytochrome c oxidase subunit 1
MGIVSDVLPTFARKPLFGYAVVVFSGIAIGFVSWGVWAHHMFTVGLGPAANTVFAITTMAVAIPTGVKVFNWLATLWGGSISFKTPMLFALGFISMFTIGGLSGVTHAVTPSDYQQQDTYYIVAHFHYVLFGGSIFGLFAGIYYWLPKITGRLFDEGLGKLHFWLMLIGFNLTFAPMHILGLNGMPRRIYTYPEGMGWDFWNLVETIGAFVIAVSVIVFIINAFKVFSTGEPAGADPWDGRTLEWSIPSPPPVYNFATIPTVHNREPFWHEKYVENAEGRPIRVPAGGAIHRTPGHTEEEAHGAIHVPSPSYWPLVTALGLFLLAFGMVFGPKVGPIGLVSLAGVMIMVTGIYAWAFEPVAE